MHSLTCFGIALKKLPESLLFWLSLFSDLKLSASQSSLDQRLDQRSREISEKVVNIIFVKKSLVEEWSQNLY